MPKPNNFDIPRVFYFKSQNIFTGSRKELNFRIVPNDETLEVCTWHGFICHDLAEIEQQQTFPLSDEGYEQMLSWLEEQYQA